MSAGDPRISLADVEHVARLARLALSPDEKERMRRELNSILGYIDKLLALDTEGVPPTSHAVPMTNVIDRHDRTVCSRSSCSRSTCSMSESVTPDAASTPSGPMMAYNDA